MPSHRPSAFPFIFQELTRNASRKSGTPITAKSPTIKYPMVRPQGYSTLQKPISGYQPQVGSDRVALINLAVRTLGNDYVQQVVVSLITTYDLSRLLTEQYGLQQPRPRRSNFKQNTHHASHLQLRVQLAENKPNTKCLFQYNSHQPNGSIKPRKTLSTHSLGDEPPPVASSGTTSAQR